MWGVPVCPLRRGGMNQFNEFAGGILHMIRKNVERRDCTKDGH